MNATMTKAFNAITSTVKGGAAGLMGAGRFGMGAYQRAIGAGRYAGGIGAAGGLNVMGRNIGPGRMAGALAGIGGAGMSLGRSMARGGWRGTTGVAGLGAAGLGAGAATADFLNPWGLGWGD